MVSFTGSSENGKKISELCSKNLKKNSLELGGKNCAIVFDSGNLKKLLAHLLKDFYIIAAKHVLHPLKFLSKIKILINLKRNLLKKLKNSDQKITAQFQLIKI